MMAGSNDIEMDDGTRVSGSPVVEDQFFQPLESLTTGTGLTPSWVRNIMGLLTQLLTSQQTGQRESANSEELRLRHSQPYPEKFSGVHASKYPQFRSL